MRELIGDMLTICDEVASGKIVDPLKARDSDLVGF